MNIIKHFFNKEYKKELEDKAWKVFVNESKELIKEDLKNMDGYYNYYFPWELYDFHLDYIHSLGFDIKTADYGNSQILIYKENK